MVTRQIAEISALPDLAGERVCDFARGFRRMPLFYEQPCELSTQFLLIAEKYRRSNFIAVQLPLIELLTKMSGEMTAVLGAGRGESSQ